MWRPSSNIKANPISIKATVRVGRMGTSMKKAPREPKRKTADEASK
jgi:hypothetical protein